MGDLRLKNRGAIAALLLAGAAAFAPFASFAQAPTTRMVSPETEKRIQKARERGFWIIEEGDYLYRIARYFVNDEAQTGQVVRDLRELNPNALMNGGASKLVVGARLTLPRYLVTERIASPAIAAAPPAVPPVAAAPSTAPAPKPSIAKPVAPPASVPPVTAGVPPIAAGASEPPPRTPPPVPPASPAYVDRVIAGVSDDRELGFDDRPRDTTPGVRQWAVELRSEHRDLNTVGSSLATGIGFRYSMETERYGDFALIGQVTNFRPPSSDPEGQRTAGSATLLQQNFSIASGVNADSALGVVRPLFPPFLMSSYRVNVTPSLLSGFQTTLSSERDEVRMGIGRIGQLSGFGIQQFERTAGDEAALAYAHRIDKDWSIGAAAIGVRNSDSVANHATGTFGINREYGPGSPGLKLQAALSDDGQGAAWFDGQVRDGRLLQRFGAWYVDPNFKFGEGGTARDTRGAYWRGEYRAGGNFYSFGAEASSDNLDRDPIRGGSDNVGGFANFTMRLDRTMQAGAGGSLRQEEPRTPTGIARTVGYASGFLSKSWDLGVSRLDVNSNTSRPRGDSGDERTNYVGWNQEWPRLGPVDFTTLLAQTNENLVDRRTVRRLASASARGPIYGTLRWDASFTFVDADDNTRGSERNYNAAASLDWNPAPAWTLQLLWFRNTIQPGADNPLSPFVRENSVQLVARYEDSAGSPYPRVSGGRSGTGRVAGSIFFDENGDGVRQPNERGAAGVTVILDERQSAVTDSDGRYAFPLVPSGPHRVRVVVERVPLPWGLDEDTPRDVRVDVRADARLDIGLKRISP